MDAPARSAPQPIDVSCAPHYGWAGNSDGWHLVDGPDLSVIQERVPPGDREVRHFHASARQFFYVLTGDAVLEVAGQRHRLRPGQGIEIPPGTPHQFINESSTPVTFLVISAPHARGDRVQA